MFWMYGKREWHSRSTKTSLGSVLTTIFIFDKTHVPLEEIAPHWEKTMCYSCYGLPQVDYKRCVIPARDSLKGITNDVLFLIETPSRGLYFVLAELILSRNNLLYVIHLSYKSSIQIIIYKFNGTRLVIYQTIISNFF